MSDEKIEVAEESVEEQAPRVIVFEEGLEAILFAAGHPVSYATLARVFDLTPSKIKDKVLEYSITSHSFDFLGLNTQIEEFGRKHRISQRKIYNIQAYIEEMCMQIILPQMSAPFEMLVTVEYSEEQDDAGAEAAEEQIAVSTKGA